MKKDEVEFLNLEDTDNFEDDFMLVSKKVNNSDKTVNTVKEKEIEETLELDDIRVERPIIKEEEPTHTRSERYETKKEVKEEIPVKIEKKEKVKKVKKDKMKKEKKTTKPTKLAFRIRLIFCLVSIVFLLGCCVFYGCRMVKYYKIFNPKSETGEKLKLFGNSVIDNNSLAVEGAGLYRIAGAYVFKGKVTNNYVKYNGLLWRIIKINSDNSVDMITEDYVNELKWNSTYTSYDKSDIREYLNDKFLNTLDKSYLTTASYCLDLLNLNDETETPSSTCTNTNNEDYVRLLSVQEFLNTMMNNESYLADVTSSYMWLNNASNDKVWHTSALNVSTSTSDNGYLFKAVVHVKNSAAFIDGDGTIEKPYVFVKDDGKVKTGSYVKLGNDLWNVYEVNDDTLRLSLNGVIARTNEFSKKSNVYSTDTGAGYYLNNTYYNSLSYKDLLVESDFEIGDYLNSYKDVKEKTMKAYVGMLNVSDLKYDFDSDISYYLVTPGETGYAYIAGSRLRTSKISIARNIKPAIVIKKDAIKGGTGTKDDPYIAEEKDGE